MLFAKGLSSFMDEIGKEAGSIRVEVAFALPDRQEIIELLVRKGCTAEEAVKDSGIQEKFPEFSLDGLVCGIFSRPLNGKEMPLPADYVLEENDRVEIYRPLEKDPKQARLDRIRNKKP